MYSLLQVRSLEPVYGPTFGDHGVFGPWEKPVGF